MPKREKKLAGRSPKEKGMQSAFRLEDMQGDQFDARKKYASLHFVVEDMSMRAGIVLRLSITVWKG